jgi:hypothetical protein
MAGRQKHIDIKKMMHIFFRASPARRPGQLPSREARKGSACSTREFPRATRGKTAAPGAPSCFRPMMRCQMRGRGDLSRTADGGCRHALRGRTARGAPRARPQDPGAGRGAGRAPQGAFGLAVAQIGGLAPDTRRVRRSDIRSYVLLGLPPLPEDDEIFAAQTEASLRSLGSSHAPSSIRRMALDVCRGSRSSRGTEACSARLRGQRSRECLS